MFGSPVQRPDAIDNNRTQTQCTRVPGRKQWGNHCIFSRRHDGRAFLKRFSGCHEGRKHTGGRRRQEKAGVAARVCTVGRRACPFSMREKGAGRVRAGKKTCPWIAPAGVYVPASNLSTMALAFFHSSLSSLADSIAFVASRNSSKVTAFSSFLCFFSTSS